MSAKVGSKWWSKHVETPLKFENKSAWLRQLLYWWDACWNGRLSPTQRNSSQLTLFDDVWPVTVPGRLYRDPPLAACFVQHFMHRLSLKNAFRARHPSKTESLSGENEAFPLKTESWRCENEAFVRDIPRKVKVEDVKTKLSCETSLKNWKFKFWKRSFRARHPSKSKSWRYANEAFVRDVPQKRTTFISPSSQLNLRSSSLISTHSQTHSNWDHLLISTHPKSFCGHLTLIATHPHLHSLWDHMALILALSLFLSFFLLNSPSDHSLWDHPTLSSTHSHLHSPWDHLTLISTHSQIISLSSPT